MDPASAIGVAAAVVQFVDVGVKVTRRLTEYVNASPGDVPKPLQDVLVRMPLIVKALSEVKSETSLSQYDSETRLILHGVALGCLKLGRELDEISTKISPIPGESLTAKLKKVLRSLKSENRITEIDLGLQAYIQVLILHQVVNPADVNIGPVGDVAFFEVKEQRVEQPLPMKSMLDKLHAAFYKAARAQTETPEFVILEGKEGAGKTQLALAYCQQANELGQFRVIFWLDASSPASLKRGLENTTSTIRQTRSGTADEKVAFLTRFLENLWQPWLLVLDDYNHKAFDGYRLDSLLPDNGHGAVLVVTRSSDQINLGSTIKVHKPLTKDEDSAVRSQVSVAIRMKQIGPLIDALSEGFDVNSYSVIYSDDHHQPMVNVAAEQGFPDALRLLLEMGADPHLNKSQSPALGMAAYGGNRECVEICLDHEDGIDYQHKPEDWAHVYRWAISKCNPEVLKLLLKRRGIEIDPDNRWVAEGIGEAARHGHVEILRILAAHDIFPKNERVQGKLLGDAIKGKQVEMVKYLLTQAKVSPDAFNDSSMHPLATVMDLHRKGDDEVRDSIISLLIDAGSSLNAEGTYQQNYPLHLAATYELPSSTKLLLKYGADPSPENWKGETALERAIEWDKREVIHLLVAAEVKDPVKVKRYYGGALKLVAEKGNRELALPILEKADIDTVDEDTGRTALMIAIKSDHLALARLFVRKGARQDIPDKEGDIALLAAAGQGQHLLIRDLIKAKDSPGTEVCDAKGYTPLMRATRQNHLDAVHILMGLGADQDAMNKFGETAMDIAEERKYSKIYQALGGTTHGWAT